jgi:3-deoxy-D-manno-octulosonic-acid transferase
MMMPLYRGTTNLAGPLIRLYLARRLRRGKEDSARFSERLGIPSSVRPEGPLIWIHGASVGEAISALPLIAEIRTKRPDTEVLLTTGTVTSATLIADRLPPGCRHQYVPVDRAAYVKRFLDHWRPHLAIWLESEFWPNLMTSTRARAIPMVLINGRVSGNSLRRWGRMPGLARDLIGCFDLCLGQTEADAKRLARLGASDAQCIGNLKFAAPQLPTDPIQLATIKAMFGDRPRWLAASTHPGEEAMAGRVHRALEAQFPGLLSIIVPRHPDRGGAIAETLTRDGLRVGRRACGEILSDATQVYIADTMGELGTLFSTVEIVFVGKSLVPLGGQNPLEPARLDCAVLFGPHMGNFTDMANRMVAAGGAKTTTDEAGLARALTRLLTDGDERGKQAAAARAFADGEAQVLGEIMAALMPHLENLVPAVNGHARA